MATGVGSSGNTRIRAAKIFAAINGSNLSPWVRNAMVYMDDSSSCDSGRPKVINYSGSADGVGFIGTDSTSRKLDTKVWEYKQSYIVAAGNGGPVAQTIFSLAVAKNALAVGNVRASATWTFRVNGAGAKKLTFGTWSENGGSQEQDVTIN